MDVTQSNSYLHHGEVWRRVSVLASDRYVMGVDLGQSNDPTAISVIHHSVTPLDDWEVVKAKRETRQKFREHFDVRHLERVPLGTPYPQVVQRVADLYSRPPLKDTGQLVIDETGVGRAVADIFETAGMRPQRVAITAGSETTNPDARRWHVPKATLISTVDALLHIGQLRFAVNLTDAGALAEELKDFRRKVSDAGRATYNARTGKHDDLILSIAIALWWAKRPPVVVGTSMVSGLY